MPRSSSNSRRRIGPDAIAKLPESELLDTRFCDLDLKIDASRLRRPIDQLYRELDRRGLKFRPHCWLAEEWFSPDGVPGIGIPFYLAHSRLTQIEDRQMLEVEGGTKPWCMRLLRHETGHAIDSAFRLRRRKRWRELFGSATRKYPDYYKPKPYSKSYVLHLDWWYAQSHPTEDFAETFAVWLKPGSNWKRNYCGWRARKKIEYVDELMKELAGAAPPVRSRERVDEIRSIRTTLRDHYRVKKDRYQNEYPEIYDRDLRRLFAEPGAPGASRRAAPFLKKVRPELRVIVARGTGEHTYTIDQVIRDMIIRCRELDLRLVRPEATSKLELAVLLSAQTINYLHSGQHRVPL